MDTPTRRQRRRGVTYVELLVLLALLGLGFLGVGRSLRGQSADASARFGQQLASMTPASARPTSDRATSLPTGFDRTALDALRMAAISTQGPRPATDDDECSGWRCGLSRAWDATKGAAGAGWDVVRDTATAPWDAARAVVTDPLGTLTNGIDRLEDIREDPLGSIARIVWDDEASRLASEGDLFGAFGRVAVNTGSLFVPVFGPVSAGRRFFDSPPVQLNDAHRELLAMEPIPHDDVGGWGIVDTIIWKAPGGDDGRVYAYKDDFVAGHREIILAAAEENDIPPELLAGVAWSEAGGDPDVIDDLAYAARGREGELTTSFAPMSMQVRRGAETLGYDPDTMTSGQMAAVRDSLKDPQQAIFLAARHLADLRDRDFAGTSAADMTDAQIAVTATRYNRGPDESLAEVQEHNSYGELVIEKKQDLNDLLEE